MSKKPTGLSAFTQRRADLALAAVTEPAEERTRARGETVAMTVRVSRADWARLHQLAISEGISLQALAKRGFSRVFAEHGLPGIE